MIEMKNFEKIDWDAWSGCESENPKIGSIKTTPPTGNKGSGDAKIIQDGNLIQILAFYDNDNLSGEEFIYQREFKTADEAAKWLKYCEPEREALSLINNEEFKSIY